MSLYLRVLRHRDFRLLFLGQSASAVGDQAVIVALALYITQRTGSATDLGLVLAAQSVPLILLLAFGGVWADRWGGQGRRRIMLASDAARALLHGALAAAILTGAPSVGELMAIEALFGTARAFFQPAYTGLLPQTIGEDLLQDAQALTAAAANLAILVGPALGTAIVLTAGAGTAFALDAATFAVSAALLVGVRPRARGEEPARQPVLHELRAGWREVSSRPWVWAMIAAFTGVMLCGYAAWYTLAPTIAARSYGHAGIFGVLESMIGAGAVLGAVIGLRWRPARPLATGLVMILIWPVMMIAFALVAPLATVMILIFVSGVGFSLFDVWWQTALARWIPPHALSRVSAYDWMGSLALLPLGFVVAGPLAAAFGARQVLGAGAVVSGVLLAAALVPRSTRQLPGSAEQRADDVPVEARGEAQVP